MSESTQSPSPWKDRIAKVKAFVVENWLPLIFAVAITIALAYPYPGQVVVSVVVLGDVRELFPMHRLHACH